MPRPVGARNKDFAIKRQSLLSKLTDHALNSDLQRPSLRQFAIATGASEPTLRHYFNNRQGVVVAVLEEIGVRGEQSWATMSEPATDPSSAMEEYFRGFEAGMRHGGFIRAHAFGIIEGAADPEVGQAYLRFVLDPALNAIATKLQGTPGGPDSDEKLKAAAFATLSPLLVISLHQELLGGKMSDPILVESVFSNLQTWLGKALTA